MPQPPSLLLLLLHRAYQSMAKEMSVTSLLIERRKVPDLVPPPLLSTYSVRRRRRRRHCQQNFIGWGNVLLRLMSAYKYACTYWFRSLLLWAPLWDLGRSEMNIFIQQPPFPIKYFRSNGRTSAHDIFDALAGPKHLFMNWSRMLVFPQSTATN